MSMILLRACRLSRSLRPGGAGVTLWARAKLTRPEVLREQRAVLDVRRYDRAPRVFAPVTAFACSCLVPTLFLGSVSA